MNQRQCKRQRKAIKKIETHEKRLRVMTNHLEEMPPIWKLLSYKKWWEKWEEIIDDNGKHG